MLRADPRFQSLTNTEIIELWDTTTEFKERDKIILELQRRKLFPAASINQWDMDTGAYPDIKDPEFLQKLLAKREFADSLQTTWKPKTDPCEDNTSFEVTAVQRFITNFMSPKTPYMSALLYHGVGVGKTCAAVQIAEAWLEFLPNDQVIIVAPPTIQKGFYRTIFDPTKVIIGEDGEPNSASQCTGTIYMTLTNTLYEKDIDKIKRRVDRLIRKRYKIFGYISFANYIRDLVKVTQQGISEDRKNEIEKERIRKHFSGKLLITDEGHNLRDISGEEEVESKGEKGEKGDSEGGKMLTPYLKNVLQFSEGMKFCILTATPMYNTYLEIIFMFNLLLMNDKKAQIKQQDVFHRNGEITENGQRIIADISGHYVSFMRGENPLSFPIRLHPEHIPELPEYPTENPRGIVIPEEDRDYYRHLPLVPIALKGDLLDATITFTNELSDSGQELGTIDLERLVHAGNFIVPATPATQGIDSANYRARTDIHSLDTVFIRETRDKEKVYRSKIGKPEWLAAQNIGQYSAKFEFLLDRLRNAEGCCFVYSRFVHGGAIPLALVLEANGYTHYKRRRGLLSDGIQVPGGRQCALCPRKEDEHKGTNAAAISHSFVPAKYGILTGDIDISPNNEETITAQRRFENKYGEHMKVIIGSQIASEGVDLRFIRETHLIDAWYHLNKTEQILGRAIRFLSHCALETEKRNNTVYLYVAVMDNERETSDLYSYRKGYKKAVHIGNVTRIMKQSSLDCNLNHDAIVIRGEDTVRQIDSQRNIREEVEINDMPFTAICDWLDTCDYKCNPEIKVDLLKKDDSTYDEFSARWRMHQVKERIKGQFREQTFIQSENMWEILADIPRIASVTVLNEIVNNKAFQIMHNGMKGYIRFCNGYYIFQPNIYEDLSIPLAIRSAQFPIKRDEYIPILYETPEITEELVPVDESILDRWTAVSEWITYIAEYDEFVPPPIQIEYWRLALAGTDKDLLVKYSNIIDTIWWFHISFHQSTRKDSNSFRRALLFYFWDEWLQINEQKWLIYSSGLDVQECIEESQYRFGKQNINRLLDPIYTNQIQYICEDNTTCSIVIINRIQQDASDPLKQLRVNMKTTGILYGFIVVKNRQYIFKTGEPPAGDERLGVGLECARNSKIAVHMTKLIKLGDVLNRNGYGDFDLNSVQLNEDRDIMEHDQLIKVLQIKNSNRICTLFNFVLRYMDEEMIDGKRWFYRPVSAYYTGHKSIERVKVKDKKAF